MPIKNQGGGLPRFSKKQRHFLDALGQGLSVAAAAKMAGVARATLYSTRSRNPEFDRAWRDAYEAGTDCLEDEARRRAVEGVEKPVFRGGEIIGHVRDYSDPILMFLLKARRPEIFGTGARQADNSDQEGGDAQDTTGAAVRDTLYRKFAKVVAEEPASAVSGNTDQGGSGKPSL